MISKKIQQGEVFFNKELAGFIEKSNRKYTFRYEDSYFQNPEKQAISSYWETEIFRNLPR